MAALTTLAATLPLLPGRRDAAVLRSASLPMINQLDREIFGPVLHVVRYRAETLDAVIDAIHATGYGLTLGIHSRVDETGASDRVARACWHHLCESQHHQRDGRCPAYGGEGLSGAGPKARGPHYLLRFAVERALTINTAAAGGNATLLAQGEA